MDGSVVIVLALIGFAALVAVLAGVLAVLYEDWQQSGRDSSDPYRAGLDAASRISSAAFEAERLMQVVSESAKEKED